MFRRRIDLTTALRPTLGADEDVLCVQDGVGIYEGNHKLAHVQEGQVYLTSHRICYVDATAPRQHAYGLELRDVDRLVFTGRIFKSSPKITIYLCLNDTARAAQHHVSHHDEGVKEECLVSRRSRSRVENHGLTWVCSTCSYSNVLPAEFDVTRSTPTTPIPPCTLCGIKPSYAQLLRVAIANATQRFSVSSGSTRTSDAKYDQDQKGQTSNNVERPTLGETSSNIDRSNVCSRCTYSNHFQLKSCEMCGALLQPSQALIESVTDYEIPVLPTGLAEQTKAEDGFAENEAEYIKLSFRAGGERTFYQRLQNAMTQRRWMLAGAPTIPPADDEQTSVDSNYPSEQGRNQSVGIASLERRELDSRKHNETVIGSAFEDLEALMASAKEIVALAEKLSRQGQSSADDQAMIQSAKSLDAIMTRDMFGDRRQDDNLYLSELARSIAEFVTDDSRGILRSSGGIMSLVDLWAIYNSTLSGLDVVSPLDFDQAASLWEQLKLPVRLRQFDNGLRVVQDADRTDDRMIAQLLDWLQTLRIATSRDKFEPGSDGIDHGTFGHGITVQDAAHHFGWSVGIAAEELRMAEANGALCQDASSGGLRYWENWLVDLVEADGVDGLSNEDRARDRFENLTI